jgi:hypothetical protein
VNGIMKTIEGDNGEIEEKEIFVEKDEKRL